MGRPWLYLTLALIAAWSSSGEFLDQRREETLHPSFGLSTVKRLSQYHSPIAGTRLENELYFFEGREPGGTLLILGGTHPNEPAGYLAAVVMLENLAVQRGRVIVIPRANNAAFSATEPQEAYPGRFHLTNRRGRLREFRVGSRFTNVLDGWPDPVIYRHHPSGQILSGNETRNLNRAWPGRPNGTRTEQVAFAISEVVRREKVDLVIDLHEAAPEYPVIDAVVAHERAMDVAALAVVDLELEGISFRLEPSPVNFRGLIHRELGDATTARVILLESAGALQGRLRGRTDDALIVKSRDPLYVRAARLGRLAVPFPEEGIPLEVRVGRHLSAVQAICRTLNDLNPTGGIALTGLPNYHDITTKGVGYYLQ
ncbi:MAG: succinylglutamate desuccinylase [Calditrichaeota bacterium]|nr:succinylglutamate desuccinylase [Calditrichota bacterium]